MAESKRFDTKSPGCLEGLFNFLALNQRLQMPKMIAYRKHSEGNNNTLRVKVPKPKNRGEKDETIPKETNNVSPTAKVRMFIWRTLMFKKKTPRKDQKKSSSPSSSRLLRSRSIHHSKCFDYVAPDELAAHYHTMNNSSSSEMGSCHSEPPLSHESLQHPINQEPCKACGSLGGKDSIDLEAPCEIAPRDLTGENEASKQKIRDAATHHSQEFMDFLELFNAHRELFLKILHDPSLLVTPEQQGKEASSSGVVPLNKLESFPRPGGSSGKRNPIFDRSDSEKNRRSEIQRSPSRPNSDLDATKVISTRMPTGVDGSAVSLAESRSLKKTGTTSSRFKAISRKIKDVVKENRKELARITKDGVFHKLPYGQKMSALTRSPSTEKFVQEEKQIRRSYSIAESVDKYSTLYESISRDSKVSPERLSITMEGSVSLKDKKPPTGFKRITSLPEMRLCSPHQEVPAEVLDYRIGPKTYNVESDRFSSRRTNSFVIYSEGNFYPDDVTERSGDIHHELNYEEAAFVGSLEEDFRSILRSPSLSSFGQSFSHRRINSLPSFDRSFFQDRTGSFTERSIADSEPTFENMQLGDEDWLVKPPQPPGAYAANFKDEEWLVTPLKRSGVVNATDQEDEEWLVKTSQLSGAKGVDLEDEEWLVKPGQPLSTDALDSEFHFIHEFAEQDAAEPLHIYVSDKNEADFQYVKGILKKSGFSCGEVDWYASNQPVSPVIFEEAECSCQELGMVKDDPHNIVRHMLLFDLINEVLLDIYDSSLVIGSWHSRFDLRTRPIPMGSHVLEEVWAKVSCYLSLQWKQGQTVEDIVAHDLMMKDNWMNLVYDAEYAALDLEDLMVEDFLDDVVIQIVLESIDE
ncbi:uncharacterized protein LOC133904297 [Phragmites australis]|uniref:uncharacterized protein LOC133904297 n=1 Tax=Phragmites australis TaxID=29695 RepID=UPI002D770586|nr:uncharacterized protein LOC133904297 [Phragmites australis]XP_062201746.1 uncharacterized protein LOC133904297 [Phragmites australis]